MINCTDNDGNVDYNSFLNLIDYRPDAKREKSPNQNDGAIDHLNTARNNYATNYATHDAHVNKIPTKVCQPIKSLQILTRYFPRTLKHAAFLVYAVICQFRRFVVYRTISIMEMKELLEY